MESGSSSVHVGGSDTIKVGLIGCGSRGCSAAADCVKSSPNIVIRAVGDIFREKARRAQIRLNVSDDHCFWGFDAYRRVIESGVDLVILATPPGFRPQHFKAAVEAGKHVFLEKPVAVDPAGVRVVLEAAALAEQKKLGVVAGTQRRHARGYIDTIQRIHDGAIGQVLRMSVYWNTGTLWGYPRQPGQSDMEWQLRNWYYFTWLSGDHIVEQHVHNLDVANWVLQAHPISAYGMGGRQVRTSAAYGHIYDHFAVEYEYPNGARVLSMCRQTDGTDGRVAEHVTGTLGTAIPAGSIHIKGREPEGFGGGRNPYIQEHADLIASIRRGQPLNEGRQVAESTLTAIMGRMSAYTGKRVSWQFALNSQLNLFPAKLELGDLPIPPVPMPGKDPLI